MARFLDADPATLLLPTQRQSGADPWKLQRQIARYGNSMSGMPMIWVVEDVDGRLEILDGVTRATRVAELAPGVRVTVEVIEVLNRPSRSRVTIADTIP